MSHEAVHADEDEEDSHDHGTAHADEDGHDHADEEDVAVSNAAAHEDDAARPHCCRRTGRS